MIREEHEEDLSFLDEEFLDDIFPAAAPSGPTYSKPTTSLPHRNTATAQVTLARGGLNGDSADHPVHTTQLNKSLEKLTQDCDDDEFGDDLSLDTIDEEKLYQSLEAAKTPPDSAFFQSSMSCNTGRSDQTPPASKPTAAQSTAPNNFRFKLLQTIKRTKENNWAEASGRQEPRVPPLQTGEKRSPDALTRDEDFAPSVKRQSVEYSKTAERQSFARPPFPTSPATQKTHGAFRRGGGQVEGLSGGSRDTSHPPPAASSARPVLPQQQRTGTPRTPVVQKRKFPGPAGILLPQQEAAATVTQDPEEEEPHGDAPESLVCSQSTADVFAEGPWQQMLQDLEVEPGAPQSPLGVLTVRWVVRQASVRGHAGLHKVPFLAVLVHSLEPCDTVAATASLRDPTGEMSGSIAVEVLREYGEVVQAGCVLLLRGVTVFTPGGLGPPGGREHHRSRRHLLNIVLSSLLTIYTPDSTGRVLTTTVNSFDRREVQKQAAAAPLTTTGLDHSICEVEEDEASQALNTSASLYSSVNQSFAHSPGQHGNASAPRFPGQHNPRPIPGAGPRPGHHRPPGTLLCPPRTPHRLPINLPRLPASNPPHCPSPYRFTAPTMRHPTPGGPPRHPGPRVNLHPTHASPAPHGQSTTSPVLTTGKQQYRFRNLSAQSSTQAPSNKQLFQQQPSKPLSMQHKPVLLERNMQPSIPSNAMAPLASNSVTVNNTARSAPLNSSMLPSQEEEQQITELLAGIDEDSLFGDF